MEDLLGTSASARSFAGVLIMSVMEEVVLLSVSVCDNADWLLDSLLARRNSLSPALLRRSFITASDRVLDLFWRTLALGRRSRWTANLVKNGRQSRTLVGLRDEGSLVLVDLFLEVGAQVGNILFEVTTVA